MSMSEAIPYLSIIIPVYNEEKRIAAHFDEVASFMDSFAESCELIVVENGSTDNTAEVVMEYKDKIPSLKLLREKRRGKGLAVRRGMLEARGRYRFMCDVDLSMPLSEVHKFLPPEQESFDIAIGTREAWDSKVTSPVIRILIRKIFNCLVRNTLLPGIQDALCGFKCLRGEVAEALFHSCVVDGISFDLELLYLARLRGLKVTEIPIVWTHDADSRVSLFSDSLKTLHDIQFIKKHHAQDGNA